MANPNLLDIMVRKQIIDDINSPENKSRKANEQRKFDIYRKRQAGYVIERLKSEFESATVDTMRKVLSINPAKRIVDEQASLYVDEPERHFADASQQEQDQLKKIYEIGKVNPQMRLANRYYKLHNQAALYVLPKDGKLCVRALTPKDYDVVPDADDPEKAFAYVLNVWDKDSYMAQATRETSDDWSDNRYNQQDRKNQTVADKDDRKAQLERYVFWTADMHFTCNGDGEIVSEAFVSNGEMSLVQPNPIEALPFVDIANEKDFSFFVQIGSDVTEFVIDLLVQLSDLANTCRFQAYSQAIIYSVNEPKGINVGPNKVIWLQIDPNADSGQRPEFTFQSPSPDIMGALEAVNVQLKMFLSSMGLNPGTVSGKNEMEKFTSGIDHLLSNLDKFKASQEDMDLFRCAEKEVFDLIVKWQDVMFDVTDDQALDDELTETRITNPDIAVDVAYKEPQSVMTQTETEDSCINKIKNGLMTKKEAIKKIYGVDDAKADEILEQIKAEREENAAAGLSANGDPLPPQLDKGNDDADPDKGDKKLPFGKKSAMNGKAPPEKLPNGKPRPRAGGY